MELKVYEIHEDIHNEIYIVVASSKDEIKSILKKVVLSSNEAYGRDFGNHLSCAYSDANIKELKAVKPTGRSIFDYVLDNMQVSTEEEKVYEKSCDDALDEDLDDIVSPWAFGEYFFGVYGLPKDEEKDYKNRERTIDDEFYY